MGGMDPDRLATVVDQVLAEQPVTDLHTHCYPPTFGHSADGTGQGLLLWGIDELVTYHYLVAEVYRVVPAAELPYPTFWQWSKREQADHIWKHLFVERTPVSEACRGVLTTLARLGLDPNEKTLEPYRQFFGEQEVSAYIDRVMELAGVDSITMTNAVFDDAERQRWLDDSGIGDDPRFEAVLRCDPLVRDWPGACRRLREWGYRCSVDLDTPLAIDEAKRFVHEWIDRMKAIYVAMSLPPAFRYPSARVEGDEDPGDNMLERVLLPVLAERGLPFAMMIGSRLRVNPALADAGDMCGKADILAVVNLCAGFPDNKFMVTMLSRENQHELCVAARKFGNLLPFGCWWFLNNPSVVDEITRERLELLGTSFAPQHSDARILDQLIYKWDHSRKIIAGALVDQYARLQATGFALTPQHIRDDARLLFRDNFRQFVAPAPAATSV